MRGCLVRDREAPSFLSSGLRCPIQVAKAPFYISRCLKVSVEDLSFSETCCRCRGKWQEAKSQGTVLTLSSERIPVPAGFTQEEGEGG